MSCPRTQHNDPAIVCGDIIFGNRTRVTSKLMGIYYASVITNHNLVHTFPSVPRWPPAEEIKGKEFLTCMHGISTFNVFRFLASVYMCMVGLMLVKSLSSSLQELSKIVTLLKKINANFKISG